MNERATEWPDGNARGLLSTLPICARAEMQPEALLQFIVKFGFAERGDACGLGTILGAHQRRAFAGQRQDRERTRRKKMLFGAAVVIPLVTDGDHDAGLIVVPAVGDNAGALAQF